MQVFILTSAYQEVIADSTSYENAQDVLYSGFPSFNIEELKSKLLTEIREELVDNDLPYAQDFVLEWTVDKDYPDVWHAKCEELGAEYLIRMFDI